MIDALSPSGRILIMGSGLYRSLEKEILERRPDLLIYSVDPTLGLIDLDAQEETDYTINRFSESWMYILRSENCLGDNISHEQVIAMQSDRLQQVTEIPGAVAALAPDLPFADRVFDMVIDVCGPCLYLPEHLMKQYQEEVRRVSKLDATILLSD